LKHPASKREEEGEGIVVEASGYKERRAREACVVEASGLKVFATDDWVVKSLKRHLLHGREQIIKGGGGGGRGRWQHAPCNPFVLGRRQALALPPSFSSRVSHWPLVIDTPYMS
jgi:hypothetical protein